MSNCLNCGVELTHTEGKKERKYCSDKCRISFFQKNKKKEQKYVLKSTYDELLAENKALKERLTVSEVQHEVEVPKKQQKNASDEISEPIVEKPKLTQEEIKQKIAELEQLKKEEQGKKCAGWMNPRKFALAKETKIDEINEQINELKQSLNK